ncbi:MAG: hypothetical protein NHG12_00175 [Candidatus Shikimatogenerans bostrichidophilus]|nr:MAG: hypothetical protein NHG12_00175 [Candidatus Shikimatogenerans bostrichidophilus]
MKFLNFKTDKTIKLLKNNIYTFLIKKKKINKIEIKNYFKKKYLINIKKINIIKLKKIYKYLSKRNKNIKKKKIKYFTKIMIKLKYKKNIKNFLK